VVAVGFAVGGVKCGAWIQSSVSRGFERSDCGG
jgi:hypothetical protein